MFILFLFCIYVRSKLENNYEKSWQGLIIQQWNDQKSSYEQLNYNKSHKISTDDSFFKLSTF